MPGTLAGVPLGDHPSMRPTRGFRSEDRERAVRSHCLALLLVGVTQPPGSLPTLVRSYRTVSPLPVLPKEPSAVCSLLPCTVRSLRPGSRQHHALWSPDLPQPGCDTEPRSPERLTDGYHSTVRHSTGRESLCMWDGQTGHQGGREGSPIQEAPVETSLSKNLRICRTSTD